MRNICNSILILLIFISSQDYSFAQHKESIKISWDNKLRLPEIDGLPSIGVAGAYSAVVGEYLIVAGGANFPHAKPWDGGEKIWHSTIYYKNIKKHNSEWKISKDGLPNPLGYGVSIELPNGLLCIGGCDANRCYNDTFLIEIINDEIRISNDFPKLPVALANATGAKVGECIFVAGGNQTMQDQIATSHFFMLSLSDIKSGWKELASWNAAPRGYAVSAAQNNGADDCFYLFSGRNYAPGKEIEILNDGHVYNPRKDEWQKLAGKFPVMAGSALPIDREHILLLGGSDTIISGSDAHPGFGNNMLFYNTRAEEIIPLTATYPLAVTTSVAHKKNIFYMGSGEIKPGIRTPIILKGKYRIK